ncbi:MAG TPA: HAMP domain-containing sensor histidine kinase [Cyclobacteriaceae bacterium]
MRDFFKKISLYLGIYDPTASADFFSGRRSLLYSRILVTTGCVSFLTFSKDFLEQGIAPIPLLGLLCFMTIVVAFFLKKHGMPVASRFLFLILLNSLIGTMCAFVPADRLAFVYFFPMITIAYVVFDHNQNVWRWIFVIVPVVLILILILTDFKPFGDHQLSLSTHGHRNMIINQIAAALVISLCFDFVIKTNAKSEKLLQSYAVDAQSKKEDLEKINGELDRFVYSASHDLRAPLLSIQGLVSIALSETDNSNDKRYYSLIGDRVSKLDEFIKEIIEYSRNARTVINYEEIKLKELAEEVIGNLQYMEGTDQIDIYILAPDEPMLLDKSRTKIILSNIISNAIKYHNLRQENPWVEVKTITDSNNYVISIADNGTGILPDKVDRVFDMFFRATDRSAGSGLGLFIVKEAVDKLGGKIALKSEYGKGSEFIITLPLPKQ